MLSTYKIKKISWVFLIIIMTYGTPWAKQFGAIQRDAKDARIYRNGDVLTYVWDYTPSYGPELTFQISIYFWHRLNFMDYMYSKSKKHDHKNYQFYIYHDVYKIYLSTLAQEIRKLACRCCINEVDLALSFVQALPYQKMEYYQKNPVETLIHAAGDCSDTSVLFAAILARLGYGTILLDFENHLAVGIKGGRYTSGTYWTLRGWRYFYCETTGTGWKVGECPKEYRNSSANLIAVS